MRNWFIHDFRLSSWLWPDRRYCLYRFIWFNAKDLKVSLPYLSLDLSRGTTKHTRPGTYKIDFSLDRGLNEITSISTIGPRPYSSTVSNTSHQPVRKPVQKKRMVAASFSAPLQTLHENLPLSDANRPDEDFGFDSKMFHPVRKESKKIINAKKSDSKVRQ